MNFTTYGFIGLGLIGGSIAEAIRKLQPKAHMIAYDTNVDMIDSSLQSGIINEKTLQIDHTFSKCDLIFLCAPVLVNNDNLRLLRPFLRNDTLVTDVGSVKSSIHETVNELALTKQFIGGHPMTGSEKTGFSNANPLILENAYYILTPTDDIDISYVTAYKKLIMGIGALPLIISHTEHDYVAAAISHVPHLIAAALVNMVHTHDTESETMKLVAAGGFKDITRIASSSPAMWEAICMANAENISNLLESYINDLTCIKNAIRNKQQGFAYQLFTDSKEYRDSFANQARGPIKKIYACYVDIPDETGSLATIALILANKKISIKNIGIIHNREFEEGVLQIEFYEQKSLDDAISFLHTLQYDVYERK